MGERREAEKWVSSTLITIETKISRAGDAAIQLVFKTVEGVWVREWMGLEKCPDVVWERTGAALGLGGDAKEIAGALCNAHSAAKVLNKEVLLGTYDEVYEGKTYARIADMKPDATGEAFVADIPAAPPIAPKQAGVPQDDIPF